MERGEADLALPMDLNPDEVMETRWISFYDLAAEVNRYPERFTAWLQAPQ